MDEAKLSQVARDLCVLRGKDPDVRVWYDDGVSYPDGPTYQTLVSLEVRRHWQINYVLQKHEIY